MFGRQPGTTGSIGEAIPPEEGQPIYDAARQAVAAGRTIFTCAVPVGFTSGSGITLGGGKKTTHLKAWDSAPLIEAIEALGWRLESLNHVWAQTEQGATAVGGSKIKGLTIAHLLFRRER